MAWPLREELFFGVEIEEMLPMRGEDILVILFCWKKLHSKTIFIEHFINYYPEWQYNMKEVIEDTIN